MDVISLVVDVVEVEVLWIDELTLVASTTPALESGFIKTIEKQNTIFTQIV